MSPRAKALLALLLACPAAARAQDASTGTAPAPSTAPATAPAPQIAPVSPVFLSTETSLGAPLRRDKGPWVLGDVRFLGNKRLSEYAMQSKVRARKGSLYMPEDVDADVGTLLETGSFARVSAAVYAIEDQPVPERYLPISISKSQARLVFTVEESPPGSAPALPPTPLPEARKSERRQPRPSIPVSGVVLTPTAYRGYGTLNEPGLALDFNGVYYIGRLYGKNSLGYTTAKTNFLDRIGLWLLSADGKMQLQSETALRPAFSVGAQGIFSFRDAPQPSIATPGVTASVSAKTTRALADVYAVASKQFGGVRSSVGFMQGNFGDVVGSLTEFLSEQALLFDGHPGQKAESKSVLFANTLLLPHPSYPLAVEFLKPNGMALNPWLLNFKLGYFLHLNFDVSYLRFKGGWDLLGTFQFRTNYFPRR